MVLEVLEVVLQVLEVVLKVFAQGFSLKVPKAKGGGVWFWALLMRILE